ncbi:Kelch repeat-containing protein [Paenibacillus alvei]|uniref:Uncharacterized protein n=1 Tax=Paenibacillus alvei TaxID=44250 RepID=A0A383RFZ3_PAEAL|nr:kelch repeat-containing protein [Paenibacillus alvei]SYX86015.1 protein of unknown function [Paenibacillus alvei]
MTDLHIKVAGMWKKSKNISVNISGKWRDAREVWIRVNGKWIKGWSNRKWVTGSNMPTGRHYCHAKVLNGFYYVVGGVDPSGSYDNGISNKNERYDISKGVWTEMASCPASKVNGAAEVTSKGFHVMNGTANYYSHYVFNPSSNTWERKTHGIPAQKPAIYYDLHADSIYKFGGFDERALKYTERYDVSRDTWTSLGEVPTARWGDIQEVLKGLVKSGFVVGRQTLV